MTFLSTALQLQRQVFSKLFSLYFFPHFIHLKFYFLIYFCWNPCWQAATKHQIPRKTLEYYVKGKATHDSYQKMGLPQPHELAQYASEKIEKTNLVETV